MGHQRLAQPLIDLFVNDAPGRVVGCHAIDPDPAACVQAFGLAAVGRFRREEPGPAFNEILARTAQLQLVFCLLLSAGLILGTV